MPYLTITSNVSAQSPDAFIQQASKLIATALGKPEQYVMVEYRHNAQMVFAGSHDPLAYLELKSIGLPEQSTTTLSDTLCNLIETSLGIPISRIYIEFTNAERHMWGWNGKTF